jgi:hypothetical protein
MTSRAPTASEPSPAAAAPRGRAAQEAAFVLLLACVAARCFLGELPFQSSALQFLPPATSASATAPATEVENPLAYRADRSELSRVTFAAAILAAWALWACGGALAGGIEVRHAWMGVPIGVFAAATFVSALSASNVRAGLDGWIEQCSLLAGGWLAIQLCTDRRRFALLAAVLAGVAAALAVKGLWQVAIEIPDRAADFVAHRAERLGAFGWEPNTPQAELIEARMKDRSITGYMALANPFGSLLLVVAFAAAGLAADKVRAAARSWQAGKAARKKGEIDLPTLSAVLAVAAAAAAVLAIPLTHSRGAILSAAAAAVGLILLAMFHRAAARHWRKCVAGAFAALVLGGALTAAYGLKHDSLPTKTMTFRWYYWTASAAIFREHPVLGVGPGNFISAYLQHRRAEAEEEVQMPHNLLAHALSEYGLPGGLCYLAAVAGLVVCAARPRKDPPGLEPDYTLAWPRAAPALAAAVAAVLLARAAFADAPAHPLLVVLDLAVPAGTLAVMLAAAAWAGPNTWGIALPGAPATRAALLCGLAAFVLHNVVEYGLWMSGPATAFFVAAGGCVAQAGGGKVRRVCSGRWALASAAGASVVLVLAALWLPVMRKTARTGEMLAAIRDGDYPAAWAAAAGAAEADRLDPRPAGDAAQVALMVAGLRNAPMGRAVGLALSWADRAVQRDPRSAPCHQLAANIAWAAQTLRDNRPVKLLAEGDKAFDGGRTIEAHDAWVHAAQLARAVYAPDQPLAELARAVELNPMDGRLRMAYAHMLCDADRPRQCLEQIARAEWLDSRLPGDSVQHFRPAERRDLAALRARAVFLLTLEAKRELSDTFTPRRPRLLTRGAGDGVFRQGLMDTAAETKPSTQPVAPATTRPIR